jgi:hypothetical protein
LRKLGYKSLRGLLPAVCAVALICGAGVRTAAQETTSGAASSKSQTSIQGQSTPSAHRSKTSARHKSKRRTVRGQQKIDPERAHEIQEALIREHYLTGKPAGTWNQASEDAMRKYQADHGWQSKTVPDSRALISLGLGPSHDHLLNPESAMTTGPDLPHGTASRSHGAPGANSPATQGASQPAPVKGQSNLPGTPSQINSQDSSTPQ